MRARPLLVTAALIAGATAFAAPGAAPVTTRYKVTETNHQVVDLSAFGQPEQVNHIVTSTWVAVTSTDSAGGRALRLVIDSTKADSVVSPQPINPALFDSLRGATATAWVAADGKLQGLAGVGEKGGQAVNILRSMFPRMHPRAKVGDHWTDTTEVTGGGDGLLSSALTRRITNWAVSGEQTVGGVKARKVEAAFSQSISGEVTSGQGTMAIDGTGTGTATYFVAPDGRQVGATTTMSLQVAVTIPQAPEPIPVNGTISSVITPIR